MLRFVTFLALGSSALASYANNINYRSPSHNHPNLGISIHKASFVDFLRAKASTF